jgi:hypothetical protein
MFAPPKFVTVVPPLMFKVEELIASIALPFF